MNTRAVTSADVGWIVEIMCNSSPLVENRERLCLGLGLSMSQLIDIDRDRYRSDGTHGYLTLALNIWISDSYYSEATFQKLVHILRAQEFNLTADEILRKLTHVPTNSSAEGQNSSHVNVPENLLKSGVLTPYDVTWIVRIMFENPVLVQRRERLWTGLGLSMSELTGTLRDLSEREQSDTRVFLALALNTWIAKFPDVTFEKLDKALKTENFNSTAESIRERQRNSIHTPYSYLQANFEFVQEKPFGAGGFGKVFHVRHKADGRDYALKYFGLLSLEEDKEGALLASLNPHPNIVRYHYCWYETETSMYANRYIAPGHEKYRFIQMEYCNDGDLRKWLDNKDIRDSTRREEAGIIFRQFIQALVHIHDYNSGIVHRDIKPENIFLKRNGVQLTVKLGDFGLAREIDKVDMTSRVGSYFYRAPELRIRRGRKYDESVDIYSAGIIYYEMYAELSLKQDGNGWDEKIGAVEDFEFIEGFEDKFPDKVSLIKLMLAIHSKHRPSALEINDFLDEGPFYQKITSKP